jgi:UPF0042 nucleotide-binding protein
LNNQPIFIITGLSGSGKSTAVAAFEDAGFYCVDNMPVALLPKFLELPIETSSEISGLAFVMDLRERSLLSSFTDVFDSLRKSGYHFEIIFLEAEENAIVRRFSQTRRHHPLDHGKTLIESIQNEKEQLEALKKAADRVIDTSNYTVHDLKSIIFKIVEKVVKAAPMRITVMSFGFKYGIPQDSDLLMDVRFLANPYFVQELKGLDGKADAVKKYVLNHDETQQFLRKYHDLIDFLLPLYEKEGKAYLKIAIGCTGGRHRSVVISENIFHHIRKPDRRVEISHRDIDK